MRKGRGRGRRRNSRGVAKLSLISVLRKSAEGFSLFLVIVTDNEGS